MTKHFLVSRAVLRTNAFLAHLRDAKSGVAAVEFALILPIMLTLYLGTVEVTKGLMASRRVGIVSRTLADITAQTPATPSLTDTDFTSIYGAATAIMNPFNTSTLKMTVTSVEFANKANGTCCDAKVKWSVTKNGSKRTCMTLTQTAAGVGPSATSVPAALVIAGSSVIIADAEYIYTPMYGHALMNWKNVSAMNIKNTSYMRPRGSYLVGYAGVNCP